MSKAIAIPAGVELTPTGLNLPANLTEADWEAIGENIALSEQAMTWAIADWWAFGQTSSTYGKTTAVAERFGWKASTLKTYAWVAKNVQPSNRFAGLPFSYHQEVASLDPYQQYEYLTDAEAEGWSHAELRRAVKGLPVQTPSPTTSKRTSAVLTSQMTIEQSLEGTAIASIYKATTAIRSAVNAVSDPEFRITVPVAQDIAQAIFELDDLRNAILARLEDEVGGLLNLPSLTA